MPMYMPLSSPAPTGAPKPADVLEREELLTVWRLRRLGIAGRYTRGEGVPGRSMRDGSTSAAKEVRWLSAVQALDGVWYVRVPDPSIVRAWLDDRSSAMVDLASAAGSTIAYGAASMVVPSPVMMNADGFPGSSDAV